METGEGNHVDCKLPKISIELRQVVTPDMVRDTSLGILNVLMQIS